MEAMPADKTKSGPKYNAMWNMQYQWKPPTCELVPGEAQTKAGAIAILRGWRTLLSLAVVTYPIYGWPRGAPTWIHRSGLKIAEVIQTAGSKLSLSLLGDIDTAQDPPAVTSHALLLRCVATFAVVSLNALLH